VNNDEIYYFELKNLMVNDIYSANFKVCNNPLTNVRKEDSDKYHVLFINFDGVGNTKNPRRKSISTIRIDDMMWTNIIKFHKNYPYQFGGEKEAYLVHFSGEEQCCLSDTKNKRATNKPIGVREKCFIYDEKPLAKYKINYKNDILPYIDIKNVNSIITNTLNEIKQSF